jgi:hypothetical protein
VVFWFSVTPVPVTVNFEMGKPLNLSLKRSPKPPDVVSNCAGAPAQNAIGPAGEMLKAVGTGFTVTVTSAEVAQVPLLTVTV